MANLYDLEPLVQKVLEKYPQTRSDNFMLYEKVLGHFIDTNMSLKDVFKNHVVLGIPALESITRCRRKLQERDASLRDPKAYEIREKEEKEYIDYSQADKLWY